MKLSSISIGVACLAVALWAGCGDDKISDVDSSESAATTIKLSEEAARKGDSHEMMNVGMTYYQGNEDVPKENMTAYIWLVLAAEDEELKNAVDLQQALADLEQSLSDREKTMARSQMKAIREGFSAEK